MRKNIAVEGYVKTLQITVGVSINALATDIGIPSSKTKVDGKGYLLDGYGVSVSAITDPGAGATIPDPGPYNITFTASASYNIENGSKVLRVDDETGVINAIPKIPNPGGTPVDYPVAFKYIITDAGQDKVLGD